MPKTTKITISLVVITLLAWTGWWYLVNQQNLPITDTKVIETLPSVPPDITKPKTLTPQELTPTPVDKTVNWKTYRNEKYGFEFKYPDEFFLDEFPPQEDSREDILPKEIYIASPLKILAGWEATPYYDVNFKLTITPHWSPGSPYDLTPEEAEVLPCGRNNCRLSTDNQVYFIKEKTGNRWVKILHEFNVTNPELQKDPRFIGSDKQKEIMINILSSFKFTE